MIVNQGREIVNKFFARSVPVVANQIVVGLSSVPALATDKVLDFEIARMPINLVGSDPINNQLIFKATLDESFVGEINEVGLVYQETDSLISGRLITGFDFELESWSAGTWVASQSKYGPYALRVAPLASQSLTSSLQILSIDLDNFSDLDRFDLSYRITTPLTSVELRLGKDDLNYFSHTLNNVTTIGAKIEHFTKSDFVVAGQVYWNDVDYISIVATSPASPGGIQLDALRISDVDPPEYGNNLVTRKVVPAFTKTRGKALEIEYPLQMSVV